MATAPRWRGRRRPAAGAGTRHRPAELPALGAGFAGRAGHFARLGRILDRRCRVLVLVGPPGVAKSSLALSIAHERRRLLPGGTSCLVPAPAGGRSQNCAERPPMSWAG